MRRLDRYRVDPDEEMAEPGFAPARPAPAVAALLRQATAGNQATRRAVAGSSGHALTLHEVVIAAFQQDTSGAITFRLNATSVDFK